MEDQRSGLRGAIFLGIDLGTSLLKLQAIDESGMPVAEASAPITTKSAQPGWAEQEASEWWDVLVDACRALWASGRVAARDIGGIALTGQMHGALFLNGEGRVLRPCLIWADSRATAEVSEIEQAVGRQHVIRITGNAANTGFTAAKVMWVRKNEPQVYSRTRHLLLPKDYLRLRLTGEYATDVSDASATLMFDLARRDWSAEMLGKLEVERGWLPKVYESPEVTGQVGQEAAEATGLRAGTPVVAGGGDAECSAFGLGLVGEAGSESSNGGAMLTNIGTSGQVFCVTGTPVVDVEGRVHSLCYVLPGRWHVMGAILSGGVALRWLRDLLTPPGRTPESFNTLVAEAEAEAVGRGAGGLMFLPYLMGERTPHMDPAARGVFFGLRLDHTRGHLVRAVMEGVAFALRDGLEVFREMGVAPEEVRPTGGGAKSRLWREIQRDVFNLPMRGGVAAHGAAYGAALLAALGTGAFSSPAQAAAAIRYGDLEPPDRAAAAEYEHLYGRYRALYPALKGLF